MPKVMLALEINVKVMQREGYYAAKTEPFAITAYGQTEEEAEERAFQAAHLLMEKYSKTPQELSEYLNKRHAKHTVTVVEQDIPRHRQITRECTREMKLLVPAGA